MFVTDVPMLAPMMIGIALWTERMSAATMVTTTDVLVLLDCSSTVPRTPNAKPATGFVTEPISCAAPRPLRPLNAFPISDRPTKNSQSRNKMIVVLTYVATNSIRHLDELYSSNFVSWTPVFRSQILNGPFSAVSTPIFTIEYSLE